jgi:hypothetical protein
MDLAVTTLPDKETDPVLFQFRRGITRPFTGLRQLAQQFAFLILKDPNQDPTSLGLGGNLRNKVLNSGAENVRSICAEAVVTTEAQIIDAQAKSGVAYLPSEKLKAAHLISVEIIDDVASGIGVHLDIQITSTDNNSIVFPIDAGSI